jgi:hypothetical protein
MYVKIVNCYGLFPNKLPVFGVFGSDDGWDSVIIRNPACVAIGSKCLRLFVINGIEWRFAQAAIHKSFVPMVRPAGKDSLI